ncbi:AMP-binding protein [Methanobrevibacter olleyae]|uniref:Acetyl-CoA synthetase n=1 Tax=Methanobrevibacter olleyae TaxID=294671 RepID=A0A126R099_METOL|nr:AMP-binding protein [Methanobrevibacter olleyae]AMK15492.1 acetyl-CoA synthetase AcsA [Methanobrevibacter olleyae]SFL38221.1 acetyl-CoA synthetase [Methanobrevibacter olleyae]
MTSLIGNFVNRVDFKSYKDFYDNFEFNIPKDFNFGFDVVDEYARIDPDKLALIWCDDSEKRVFTFSDMKRLSNQTANFFKSYGIKKGDAVLLTLKNRYEFWICMTALHKIGAVAIPTTHMVKLHDIAYRVENADVKMVVSVEEDQLIPDFEACEKELGIELKKALVGNINKDGWINFDDEISKMSDVFERPTGEDATHEDETFLIYFSSGTTGNPKMVAHAHTYAIGHLITAKYWHNVVEDGVHHTSADTGWGKAVWGNYYGQWISGSAVFIYDYVRFNGLDLMEKIIENKVNTFCAPPTIYRFLIKEDLSQFDFSNIEYATTAGEPLPPEVFNRFKEFTGLEIKEGFGQTETTLSLATFIWMESKTGSVGKPSPAFEVKLLDKEHNHVDIGSSGEICFDISEGQSVGLFKEYYRNQEKTDEVIYDNFYHCGDTAYIDEDGYFTFIGRNDDIIKSSGYRIGPYEVENAVISHPSVLECAITGVPDELRGQIVKATIVLAKGFEASEELKKEIQTHVKHETAPYKYPRMIEFVEELPKTISGKIQRKVIRIEDEQKI